MGNQGIIARVCPQGNRGYSKGGHTEKREMCVDADEECVDVLNTVYVLRKTLSSPIVVRVKLNGKEAAQ